MNVIRTVLEYIDTGKLGWCECRGHLFVANGSSRATMDILMRQNPSNALRLKK